MFQNYQLTSDLVKTLLRSEGDCLSKTHGENHRTYMHGLLQFTNHIQRNVLEPYSAFSGFVFRIRNLANRRHHIFGIASTTASSILNSINLTDDFSEIDDEEDNTKKPSFDAENTIQEMLEFYKRRSNYFKSLQNAYSELTRALVPEDFSNVIFGNSMKDKPEIVKNYENMVLKLDNFYSSYKDIEMFLMFLRPNVSASELENTPKYRIRLNTLTRLGYALMNMEEHIENKNVMYKNILYLMHDIQGCYKFTQEDNEFIFRLIIKGDYFDDPIFDLYPYVYELPVVHLCISALNSPENRHKEMYGEMLYLLKRVMQYASNRIKAKVRCAFFEVFALSGHRREIFRLFINHCFV